MFHEGIVFLSRTFSERLEPVCAVRNAHFHGPLLHAFGHLVGHGKGQHGAFLYHLAELLVGFQGQVLEHFLLVEDILAKIVRRTFGRRCHFNGAFLERFFHNFKTKGTHRENMLRMYM